MNNPKVFAKKEVILSAGAIESPKLLALSGIWSAKHLHDSNVLFTRGQHIGLNLKDYPVVHPFTFELTEKLITLASPAITSNDLVRWLGTHEGPLAAITDTRQSYPGLADVRFGFVSKIGYNSGNNLEFIPSSYYDQVMLSRSLPSPRSTKFLDLRADASGAVVDARLRINGARGLRIADASITPWSVRADAHARDRAMIAEMAADMIKEDWLSVYDAVFWNRLNLWRRVCVVRYA